MVVVWAAEALSEPEALWATRMLRRRLCAPGHREWLLDTPVDGYIASIVRASSPVALARVDIVSDGTMAGVVLQHVDYVYVYMCTIIHQLVDRYSLRWFISPSYVSGRIAIIGQIG